MGDGVSSAPPPNFSQVFEECFPYYLSIGMTYKQYWQQDGSLVIAYRKADEIRKKRINQEAWLQGAYFYSALCSVSPILHAFAPNGTEPMPYMDAPIPMTSHDAEVREEELMRKRAEEFRAFVAAKNEEHKKRKSGEAEHDD